MRGASSEDKMGRVDVRTCSWHSAPSPSTRVCEPVTQKHGGSQPSRSGLLASSWLFTIALRRASFPDASSSKWSAALSASATSGLSMSSMTSERSAPARSIQT